MNLLLVMSEISFRRFNTNSISNIFHPGQGEEDTYKNFVTGIYKMYSESCLMSSQ